MLRITFFENKKTDSEIEIVSFFSSDYFCVPAAPGTRIGPKNYMDQGGSVWALLHYNVLLGLAELLFARCTSTSRRQHGNPCFFTTWFENVTSNHAITSWSRTSPGTTPTANQLVSLFVYRRLWPGSKAAPRGQIKMDTALWTWTKSKQNMLANTCDLGLQTC